MAERINIFRKRSELIAGRQQEKEPELYYSCWCEVGSLYGEELYRALDIRLENTIIFEVRFCGKIKAMRGHLKEFYIEYEGDKYDLYAIDFRKNDKQYVQLKANRHD